MQQYLVEPLGLDGAYFGLPLTELERVARPFAASKPVRKEHNNQISKKTKEKHHSVKSCFTGVDRTLKISKMLWFLKE